MYHQHLNMATLKHLCVSTLETLMHDDLSTLYTKKFQKIHQNSLTHLYMYSNCKILR